MVKFLDYHPTNITTAQDRSNDIFRTENIPGTKAWQTVLELSSLAQNWEQWDGKPVQELLRASTLEKLAQMTW